MSWYLFLVAYGICFGFQNKSPEWFRESFLKSMLGCSYCTGFHAGWITWLLTWGVTGEIPATGTLGVILSIVSWSFASAVGCYLLDTLSSLWERSNVGEQ